MSQYIFQLSDLLKGFADVASNQDCQVSGLAIDSRQVQAGDLFLAYPGTVADGRQFIQHAVERGAAAILFEASDQFESLPVPCPLLPVSNLAGIAGLIADRFFGSPSHRLTVVGVTGTNGKTTCTQLLSQALNATSRRCAVIGTLGNGFPEQLDTTLHTTPDAITVHRLLASYRAAGAAYVCIEVSSHALQQGRVNGVAFDIAVFTNLSRDHLDYHGDMASYGAAKANLFAVPTLTTAVINAEDAFGRALLDSIGKAVHAVSFGLDAGDFHATRIETSHDGLSIELSTPLGSATLNSPLFGRFNAANLIAVLAVLLTCDLSLEQAIAGLSGIKPVIGRMERFSGGSDKPLVVVDYAHTPDALEKALLALREHTDKCLWCVFGCGGDRDRGKRPQMGKVAERLADHVVLTDDNPRHEDPEEIVREIRAGMNSEPKVIHKRFDAISKTIHAAAPGDIVLLAGKGHEDYQQLGNERIAYSDRESVIKILGEAA